MHALTVLHHVEVDGVSTLRDQPHHTAIHSTRPIHRAARELDLAASVPAEEVDPDGDIIRPAVVTLPGDAVEVDREATGESGQGVEDGGHVRISIFRRGVHSPLPMIQLYGFSPATSTTKRTLCAFLLLGMVWLCRAFCATIPVMEVPVRYLSLCSGVEAATLAWRGLGWSAAAFSEIDPFPCAVLAHRFPSVPNLGDMTAITDEELSRAGPVDLVVGGTPCQSYSVAGQRGGIDDPRGALALAFGDIATRSGARWVVWENVPGVLTSNRGRDFGLFARSLAERGFHLSYRVLDARGFGVPQQRRRVFVVGHLGDGHGPAAVLSDRPCSGGHHPQGREAWAGDTGTGDDGVAVYGGGNSERLDALPCLLATRGQRNNFATDAFVLNTRQDPITTRGYSQPFGTKDNGHGILALTASTGGADDNDARGGRLIPDGPRIRRLMPIECERAQGMPDDWTRIPWRGKPASECPDSHRYKAIGNSMAVPVMRWIGARIQAWEDGALR